MNLGFGRSLAFWPHVVELQHERLTELWKRRGEVLDESASTGPGEVHERWWTEAMADGHFLLIAVRHVLRHGWRLRDLTAGKDGQAAKVLDAFMNDHRTAHTKRDILEHFDEYWVDGRPMKRDVDTVVSVTFADDDIVMTIGGDDLRLLALGRAAIELGYKLTRIWDAVVP